MGADRRIARGHVFLLVTVAAVFVWSLVGCYDFFTWVLESFPVVMGVVILVSVYRRFRLTGLCYVLIWAHMMILLVGAHYTYARMPVFDWLRDTFELSRNHYDRVGHLAQGFVPAIIAREILLRRTPLRRGGWLVFLVICVCLAISAAYELLEWIVAVASRDGAIAFLATQGDQWDTQKDMALCLAGAVASLLLLSKAHDRGLEKISSK